MFGIAQRIILADSWTRRLIAFFSGVVGALALAPFGFFPAFFIPMTVAVWLIDGSAGETRRTTLLRAAGAGWWLGFGYFVASLWWLGAAFLAEADRFAWALPFGVLGLPAILALFTALGFVLARLLWSAGPRRLLALAVGLGAGEWLRGHVLTGFPWNDFGMVLGTNLMLAQVASFCGLYGLTLLAVLIFASPALLADQGASRLPTAGALAALAGLFLFGALRLEHPAALVKGPMIRIIQPNVAFDDFRTDRKDQLLDLYLSLSDRATSPQTTGLGDVTHLVWPESAFPFILARDAGALQTIRARQQKAILFTGAARAEGDGRNTKYYNSIEVIESGNIKDWFDKIHLAPFGEYMPLSGLLTKIGITQFVAIPGGFEAGASNKGLSVAGLPPILPMICYESIFPDETADRLSAMAVRPGLMLNVTHDGWFGLTPGPYQHLAQARLRAIEHGLPMIRAATTGISSIIDPYGREIASAPLGAQGVVDGKLPAALPATFYSAHPKLTPFVLWGLILLLCLRPSRNI